MSILASLSESSGVTGLDVEGLMRKDELAAVAGDKAGGREKWGDRAGGCMYIFDANLIEWQLLM
jgi:hypothetical protein